MSKPFLTQDELCMLSIYTGYLFADSYQDVLEHAQTTVQRPLARFELHTRKFESEYKGITKLRFNRLIKKLNQFGKDRR